MHEYYLHIRQPGIRSLADKDMFMHEYCYRAPRNILESFTDSHPYPDMKTTQSNGKRKKKLGSFTN